MRAVDVMTRSVVSIEPDMPVSDLAQLMLSRNVSAVPVVEPGGRLVGIVSEGDLMRRPELGTEKHRSWWLRAIVEETVLAAEYAKSHARTARDVMTRDVITVSEDTPLADIVGLLEKHHIKRVPVVRNSNVVGIVSRANLLRAFAAHASREGPSASIDDRATRARVLTELERQPWWHGYRFTVVVLNGIVHLYGAAQSPEERSAIRILAEGTAGVRSVENHIALIRPAMLSAS